MQSYTAIPPPRLPPPRQALQDASARANQSPVTLLPASKKASGGKSSTEVAYWERQDAIAQHIARRKRAMLEDPLVERYERIMAEANREPAVPVGRSAPAPVASRDPLARTQQAPIAASTAAAAPPASASRKRKSDVSPDDAVAAYKQNLDHIDVDNMELDLDCNEVRHLIQKVIDRGIYKKGEFCNTIGCSPTAVNRFLEKVGPDGGIDSDVYDQAWAWFKKRELAGLPMPAAPASLTQKRAKTAASRRSAADLGSMHLAGEETDSVPVYDTCDEIRRKITAHLKAAGVTQAQFCRDLHAQLNMPGCKSIQSKMLNDFRGKKGPLAGCTSSVYYAAYVYFEKLRVAEGKPKSKHRLDMEGIYPGGAERERDGRNGYWCHSTHGAYKPTYTAGPSPAPQSIAAMWDIVAGAEGNVTSGFTWEPQPERRGTFGIISSCFVTLALCTWKIVHLNLPGMCPDEGLPWTAWFKKGTTHSMRHRLVHIFGGHQITRQIGWLLIGLFAPELIAYAAFRQYWDVKSLQAFMERVYLQPVQPRRWWPALLNNHRVPRADVEDSSTKAVWTMTHSWYAVMGGYSYKLREGPKVFLPDDHNRDQLILRDEALRFVAEHEPNVIPNLTVLDILDKSSSSTFVKIIALFQALWFSLQCVVRMAQGLSISLLELTTFAHCIVALIIGWLWLRKPVDISKPDPLDMPDTVSQPHWLMALLYSLTSFDHNECDEERYTKLGQAEQDAVQNAGEGPRMSTYLDATINQDPITFSDLNLHGGRPQSSAVSMGRPVTGVPSRPTTSRPIPASPQTYLAPPSQDQDSSMTPGAASLSELVQAAADQERRFRIRMQLAQKGWDHYILDQHPHEEPTTTDDDAATTTGAAAAAQPMSPENRHRLQRRLKRTMRNTLVDRVTNFPRRRHDSIPQEQHAFKTHLGISLTGFLYGGLHMLAWDASFTSAGEAAMWKLASISLACSGLLVPVAHAEGVILNAVRPWLVMDEEDRDAEEAEHLAEKEARMGRWKHGWRRYWWKFYKWCFLWMIEVIRVVKVVGIVVVGCVYLGLRFFIFVECLANLSHLPPSAYDVVRWSQYVPHIS